MKKSERTNFRLTPEEKFTGNTSPDTRHEQFPVHMLFTKARRCFKKP